MKKEYEEKVKILEIINNVFDGSKKNRTTINIFKHIHVINNNKNWI